MDKQQQKGYAIFNKNVMIALKEIYGIDYIGFKENRKIRGRLVYYYTKDAPFEDALTEIVSKIKKHQNR